MRGGGGEGCLISFYLTDMVILFLLNSLTSFLKLIPQKDKDVSQAHILEETQTNPPSICLCVFSLLQNTKIHKKSFVFNPLNLDQDTAVATISR